MDSTTNGLSSALKIKQEGEGLQGNLQAASITVGQIARRNVLECTPDTSLQEAAARMGERQVSSILVTEDGQVVGIWTERDVLRLNFETPELLQQPVSQFMSSPVKAVSVSLTLQELAVRFQEERVRHYMVLDEQGQCCGVVSQTDVVVNQGIEHYLRLRSIDSIVHRGLQALPASAALAEVTGLMRSAGVDAVAVSYEDGSWGIITERDMVRYVANEAPQGNAGSLASRPVVCVEEQASLYLVRNMLIKKRLRHVGVTDAQGQLLGLVSFRDILGSMELSYVQELQQALRERDEALSQSRRHLQLAEQVIRTSLEGIMITELDTTIISVNPAFTRLTGYEAEEVIGKTPATLSSGHHDKEFYQKMWQSIRETGSWQGELWNKRKNGDLYPELLTITTITDDDGTPTNYAALFNDISVLKEKEERIRQLAYYDALTGLPNRRLFEDRIDVAISHAQRSGQQLAVLFIDLDHFKRINDSLGHAVGDEFLRIIADRLLTTIREQDTLARVGGDEFIALLSDIKSPAQAVQISRRMLEVLQTPITCMGRTLVVTSSIGISIFPSDGRDHESLLSRADTAMYRAKHSGRNAIQLYTQSMNIQALHKLALENALHAALDRGQFELYYQPLVCVKTGCVVSAEALLRWNHTELGVLAPDMFLPIAEELSLISPISDWVVINACRQLAAWQQAGYRDLRVSINMADRHFQSSEFLELLKSCIEITGCEPAQITLELTERMLMDDVERTLERLNAIRELGINLSLDDFGTGWSSLTHLRHFPLDELKIDREFVANVMDSGSRESVIIASLIELAGKLNLRVVAEGIETFEQAGCLKSMGCDLLQGYYFSRPVPVEQFKALLESCPWSGDLVQA